MPPPKKFGVSSLPNAGDKCMDVCCDLHMTNSIAGRNMCAKSIFTWLFLQKIWHERAHAHMHTNTLTNYSKRSFGKSVFRWIPPQKIIKISVYLFQFFQILNCYFGSSPTISSIHLDSNGKTALANLKWMNCLVTIISNHFLFITEQINDRSSAFILVVASHHVSSDTQILLNDVFISHAFGHIFHLLFIYSVTFSVWKSFSLWFTP